MNKNDISGIAKVDLNDSASFMRMAKRIINPELSIDKTDLTNDLLNRSFFRSRSNDETRDDSPVLVMPAYPKFPSSSNKEPEA